MDARALLARILEQPRVVAVRGVLEIYGRAAGGLLASGLAFSALFAAIPTTLLVLGVAGWIAGGDPTIQDRIGDALVAAAPPLTDLIRSSVEAVADGAALTSLVGLVGMLWTVSQLFAAVDVAFARIYSDAPERNSIRRTVRSLLVVGLLATTVVAIIAVLAVVAGLDALSGTEGSMSRVVIGLIGSLPFLVVVCCVVVAVGYRELPPHPPAWRALAMPAVVVGVLMVLVAQVFGYLVPRLVGVAALAGPLASGFVALAWLSISFQATLLGAAWVRVRDEGLRAALAKSADPVGSADLELAATATEPGRRGE
jgi:membrane protein